MTARWVAGVVAAAAVVTPLVGIGMGKGEYDAAGGGQAMREIVHIQAVTATGGYQTDTDGAIIVEN